MTWTWWVSFTPYWSLTKQKSSLVVKWHDIIKYMIEDKMAVSQKLFFISIHIKVRGIILCLYWLNYNMLTVLKIAHSRSCLKMCFFTYLYHMFCSILMEGLNVIHRYPGIIKMYIARFSDTEHDSFCIAIIQTLEEIRNQVHRESTLLIPDTWTCALFTFVCC